MKTSNCTFTKLFGGLFAALLVCAFCSTSAQAQVLFNNGLTNGDGEIGSDSGAFFTEAGNVFTPTLSGTANNIVFNGTYEEVPPDSLPTDNFTLTLYTGSGSPTGTPITSTLYDLSRLSIGDGFYQYSGTLTTPFNLSTGTSYFLGITDTDTPTEEFAVGVTSALGPATAQYVHEQGVGFESSVFPTSLAFELSDVSSAPEPSTWALLLGGLGLLAFWRLRTRRVEA